MRADHALKDDPALLIVGLLEGRSLPDLLKRAMSLRGKDDLIAIAQRASSPSQAANQSAKSGRRIQTLVHKAAVLIRDGNEIGKILGIPDLGRRLFQIAVANGCGELPSDEGT